MAEITTKAVVPAAGEGRRLAPVTSVVPKELFPVGRYPAIEWVVAEAVASGCQEVAVVVSPRKAMIRDYLTRAWTGRRRTCRLTFLVQPAPRGLGDALARAREFCDDRPFALLLPDDFVDAKEPPLVQLGRAFRRTGGSVIGLSREPAGHGARYDPLTLRRARGRLYEVGAVHPRVAWRRRGSALLGVGRCLLTPRVIEHAVALAADAPGRELDDGMVFRRMVRAGEPLHGLHLHGRRYDISTLEGYRAALRRFGGGKPAWTSR